MTPGTKLVSDGDLLSPVFDIPDQPLRVAVMLVGSGEHAHLAAGRALTLFGMGVCAPYADDEVARALAKRWRCRVGGRPRFVEALIERRTTPRGVFSALVPSVDEPASGAIIDGLTNRLPSTDGPEVFDVAGAGPRDIAHLVARLSRTAGPEVPYAVAERGVLWAWKTT